MIFAKYWIVYFKLVWEARIKVHVIRIHDHNAIRRMNITDNLTIALIVPFQRDNTKTVNIAFAIRTACVELEK